MTVLGIETATQVCGVAAVRDGAVIAEAALEERYAHAERIMGFVERTVTAAGGLRAIDGIAVSIGPGSFTGLRIGLSVAKGLAFAADLKIAAVPTLEAIAWRLVRAGAASPGERILIVLPARRGEAFAAWYTVVARPSAGTTPFSAGAPSGRGEHGPEPAQRPDSGSPAGASAFHVQNGTPVLNSGFGIRNSEFSASQLPVRPVAELAAEAAASGALVAGDPELLRAALPAGRSLRAADPSMAGASAVAVAQLGLELLRAGRTADPETLEPEYALDFVALTKRP